MGTGEQLKGDKGDMGAGRISNTQCPMPNAR